LKIRYFIVSLVVFITIGCPNAFAQEWATAYQESIDHYNNYESQESKLAAERALRAYKTQIENPDKNLAAILRQLALVTYELDLLDDALEHSKSETELLQSLGLNNEANYANALQNLALIRIARNEYAAAEPLLRKAIPIALTWNTETSYEVSVIKGTLATTLFQLGQGEEAKALFIESLETMNQFEEVGAEYYTTIYDYSALLIEEQEYAMALSQIQILEAYYNFETPNFEFSSILIKVGDLLDKLGRFEEAVTKYETAVLGFQELQETESEEYEIALNNLSIAYQKVNAFDKSESLLTTLVEIRKSTKENQPVAYASSLINLSNLRLKKGLKTEAQSGLEEAISVLVSDTEAENMLLARALESLAQINYSNKNLELAKEQIDQALVKIPQSENTYSLLEKKARITAGLGKYEEARTLIERSLAESMEVNGENSLATCYVKNAFAQISTDLADYPKAEEIYLEIIPQFERLLSPSHPECATIATNYSTLLQLMGNFYTAENWLKTALEIKRNAFGEENPEYLISYENLGLLYQNTARYTEASRIFNEIRAVKENTLDAQDASLAYTYTNLGNVKKELAEYTESENYLIRAKTIYQNTLGEKHIFYASLLNSLALLYQKMGNVTAAKPLLTQSLAIYEELLGKNNPEYATSLENLATLYQMEDNNEKAKSLLEEVLIIDETILGKEHPLYSKTLHNLAALYEEDGQYEKSRELYNQALSITKKLFGINNPSYASTLYNLAVLEQELENYDQAKKHFMQVVDIRNETLGEFHPDYTYASYGLASIFHKTNELEAAKSLYLEVIEKYSDDIAKYFPALSESEKSAFWGKIHPVFEGFMDYAVEFVLLNKGTTQERNAMIATLYNVQLSTKALLLNATNKVRKNILSSGDEALIASFNEWIALKENIVKAYGLSKEEIERSGIDIKELEQRANTNEKQLSLSSSAFAETFDKTASQTWQDVKAGLTEGQAAMEIIRIKKRVKADSVIYISLIIDDESSAAPKMLVNPNGLYMEDRGFKTYKNSIVYKVSDLKSYPLYWSEVDASISKSTTTLFLSADGVYNKVNISTLLDEGKNEYVIEKYSIRLLSNTIEIVQKSSSTNETQSAILYGYPKYDLGAQRIKRSSLFSKDDSRSAFGDQIAPLPGTYQEVTDIAKDLFAGGWTYDKYIADKATEVAIKKLNSPTVLHIATHGFFLPDIRVDKEQALTSRSAKYNPLLRSGLLLAGAENTINNQEISGEEDGILTAYEAMNLSLDNTQLVVMSACETGLGEVKNGEGVYGLQRAFLVAGADNLVMSLWKVNDETTQKLMSGFYKNWLKGESRIEAFNHSITDLKKEFKEPYYWGAFVILGI
jgi:CHAT domain-containing protein